MFRIILREILVLILCLAVFPVAVILLLVHNDSLNVGLHIFARDMLSGGIGPGGTSITLWVKLLSPYVVLQAIRAFLWSHRSLVGRQWANLYFSLLAGFMAAWSLWGAWDMFYFMYALGDMPAEVIQFFRLEAANLLTSVGCVFLAVYCFNIFLDPRRKPKVDSE